MKYICSNTECLRINVTGGNCVHCDSELVSYRTLTHYRRSRYTLADYIRIDVLGLGEISPKLVREILSA